MENKSIAIVTDSNSGISKEIAEANSITVVPMPVLINGDVHFENIDLTMDEFFELQKGNQAVITTSQPSAGDLGKVWKDLLQTHDAVVHIPMSSGLSSSCQTASVLAEYFEGRVHVVDNHRISVTMEQSVLDAVKLKNEGYSASEIKSILEAESYQASIYIMVDTLEYLKKGGRISPAAATLGGLLHIHPVLQIQGGVLDTYAKCRGVSKAKRIMIEAIKKDLEDRFASELSAGKMKIRYAACGVNEQEEAAWKKEIEDAFPGFEITGGRLSMSIAVHIGPGALAITCTKTI